MIYNESDMHKRCLCTPPPGRENTYKYWHKIIFWKINR